MTDSVAVEGYNDLLIEVKAQIRTAQLCAALSVRRELTMLYWHIGREILDRQSAFGWGAKIVVGWLKTRSSHSRE